MNNELLAYSFAYTYHTMNSKWLTTIKGGIIGNTTTKNIDDGFFNGYHGTCTGHPFVEYSIPAIQHRRHDTSSNKCIAKKRSEVISLYQYSVPFSEELFCFLNQNNSFKNVSQRYLILTDCFLLPSFLDSSYKTIDCWMNSALVVNDPYVTQLAKKGWLSNTGLTNFLKYRIIMNSLKPYKC